MKVIIEDSDVAEFQHIAHDYFGMTVSDGAARHLCETDLEVQGELLYGGLGDTAARDDVIAAITNLVFGDVVPPEEYRTSVLGYTRRRWDYPCNGDSDQYKAAFDAAFIEAVAKLPPDRKIEFVS